MLPVYRSPCSTESDDDIVLRVLRTVARLHGECLILGDFNDPHVNWLTRSCSMANSFSNKLLTAADEEFLHQAVMSPTRYRTGQLPSILDLVFSKYSSSIHSINHLAHLGKSDHATLQVNFVASDLPAGNISKPKWRYNKANVQGLLCAAMVSHQEVYSTTSRPFCPFRSCVTTKDPSLAQSETQTCNKK